MIQVWQFDDGGHTLYTSRLLEAGFLMVKLHFSKAVMQICSKFAFIVLTCGISMYFNESHLVLLSNTAFY